MREFMWYRDGYLDRMSREWDHTANLMALYANSKSSKGKTYSANDFHPMSQMKTNQGQLKSKEDVAELLEKMRNF